MSGTHLSIVLPAYNEAESIEAVIERSIQVGVDIGRDVEVIVVDDGSADETRDVAVGLMGRFPGKLRVASHPVNRGYGAALRTGFALAKGELVFYTDADNQFDPGDLLHFLPLMDDHDLIVGFRVYRYDPVLRSILSWIYNRLVRVLFRVRVRDVDCSFKLFRREVLESIVIECDDFFVDTELVAKSRRWNFRLLEKGVRHYPRMAGETTVQASHILTTLRTVAVMWRRIYLGGSRTPARVADQAADAARLELTPESAMDERD